MTVSQSIPVVLMSMASCQDALKNNFALNWWHDTHWPEGNAEVYQFALSKVGNMVQHNTQFQFDLKLFYVQCIKAQNFIWNFLFVFMYILCVSCVCFHAMSHLGLSLFCLCLIFLWFQCFASPVPLMTLLYGCVLAPWVSSVKSHVAVYFYCPLF